MIWYRSDVINNLASLGTQSRWRFGAWYFGDQRKNVPWVPTCGVHFRPTMRDFSLLESGHADKKPAWQGHGFNNTYFYQKELFLLRSSLTWSSGGSSWWKPCGIFRAEDRLLAGEVYKIWLPEISRHLILQFYLSPLGLISVYFLVGLLYCSPPSVFVKPASVDDVIPLFS